MEANGVLIKQQMNTGFSICIKIAFNFNWKYKIAMDFFFFEEIK